MDDGVTLWANVDVGGVAQITPPPRRSGIGAEPFSPHVGRKGSVEMMSPADFTRGALAFAGAWREWHPGGPPWEWQLAQGPFAAHLVSWPSDLDSVSH